MDRRGSLCQGCVMVLLRSIIIFSFISTGVYGRRSSLQTDENLQLINGSSDSIELQVEERKAYEALAYALGPNITDWNEQRAKWIQENPKLTLLNRNGNPRLILVTSSRTEPCPRHGGDHYLLKFLKNKIDYARLHDVEIYYNMVTFDDRMNGFFIKFPLVRKLMLTHPEVEWIWWMDSDAIFTDMSFEIPWAKYKDYNMIVPGWSEQVYEKKSWIGLNAGIFLLRNCQWSLDLLDVWAGMGADIAGNRKELGVILSKELSDRPQNFPADDQSVLVYLLSTSHTEAFKPKVFFETSYDLHGYWVMSMELHEAKLKQFPRGTPAGHDWSFITHFVGCKTCERDGGSFDFDECLEAMERAYNLADNQVVRSYGYEHEDLSSADVMRTTPRLD